jgi:hypothetical protein
MALDYSQKRMLGSPLRSKEHGKRTARLQTYAVLTGILSLLISVATLVIQIIK